MSIFGIDRATPLTMDNIKSIQKHDGGRFKNFVLRYLAPESSWKALTLNEVNRLKSAGMMIGSIYQNGKDDTKSGRQGGFKAGTEAKKRALELGQPLNSVIYFTVDYDAPPSDYDSIEQFLDGATNALAPMSVGLYAKYDIIEEMVKRDAADSYWQTLAWSKGKVSNHIDLYQYKIDTMANGVNVDYNECFNPKIFWGQSEKTISQPSESPTVPLWKYKDLEKKVYQQGVTNTALIKAVETLENKLLTLTDLLAEQIKDLPPPEWFVKEFPKYNQFINTFTGTLTFWRSFAITLRVMEQTKNNIVNSKNNA